jgi:hypothetical protein
MCKTLDSVSPHNCREVGGRKEGRKERKKERDDRKTERKKENLFTS